MHKVWHCLHPLITLQPGVVSLAKNLNSDKVKNIFFISPLFCLHYLNYFHCLHMFHYLQNSHWLHSLHRLKRLWLLPHLRPAANPHKGSQEVPHKTSIPQVNRIWIIFVVSPTCPCVYSDSFCCVSICPERVNKQCCIFMLFHYLYSHWEWEMIGAARL